MILFPAIDLYGGQAVRLYQGRYDQMTVYSPDPVSVCAKFKAEGATHVHLVDLEGAKSGETPNIETVCAIRRSTDLFCEIGGGIRNMETVEKYINAGIDRVILGTAAVKDPDFLAKAAEKYAGRIAVGIDIKDGFVAVRGWTEKTDTDAFSFAEKMQDLGVSALIVTDISRDGAMRGTNLELMRSLSLKTRIPITASGGVSSLDDVRALREMNLYGAIIGKAWYTGAINLAEAIEVAK